MSANTSKTNPVARVESGTVGSGTRHLALCGAVDVVDVGVVRQEVALHSSHIHIHVAIGGISVRLRPAQRSL